MEVRKLVGTVTITLYEDGTVELRGELDAQPCPLTKADYFKAMLRAGQDALANFWRGRDQRPKLIVPVGSINGHG